MWAGIVSMLILQTFLSLPLRAEKESYFDRMDVEQKLDAPLPLNETFTDEEGNGIQLKSYFHDKPVLITYVYYSCPQLCPVTLKTLASTLSMLSVTPGKDYEMVAVSFDPQDSVAESKRQKESFVQIIRKEGSAAGIHFLTGTPGAIQKITDAAGFKYVKDEETGQFAHPAMTIAVTPQGHISRYFFGPDYPPRDIELALKASEKSQIGSLSQKILMFCFCYDPSTGRYTLAILNLLKVAGVITMMVLGGLVFLLKRKEVRHE